MLYSPMASTWRADRRFSLEQNVKYSDLKLLLQTEFVFRKKQAIWKCVKSSDDCLWIGKSSFFKRYNLTSHNRTQDIICSHHRHIIHTKPFSERIVF